MAYSLSAADKKLAVFEETIKPKTDAGDTGKGGVKNGTGDSGQSEESPPSKRASIEELGIKIARDLVRITTVLDPAAAVRALQELVSEAQRLLSMVGKAPDVAAESIGRSPKQEAPSEVTSSVLEKGKDAA